MRVNSIKCDACCKAHPVDDEYDVSHLPSAWYTVIPGQGCGFKETMHFCSVKCLGDWAKKVQMSAAPTNGAYPDLSAMTKAETILQWIERARKEAQLGSPVTRVSVLVDDIEQLCRKE